MAPPKEVIELVEHFERNLEQYHSPQYKEAEARHEFIDPLFEALGWDVRNTRKYAEAYKDVVHEPSLESEDAPSRAPDYRFQPGGHTKFFVEAKKPSINLDETHAPALQLRRYGWTQQLPISILTNFAEFAVYDCRVEPTPADGASTARVMYLMFKEYVEKWDELFGLFSPDAVFKGSFDRFAETRKRRGLAPFDQRFLDDMEDWRKRLAGNIALRNAKLSQHDLNYAVQQTIDRVLFLRICEARGIEPFGRLRDVAKLPDIYHHLVEHFRRADDEYNSGLFHFRSERGRLKPDELTPALKIDDDVLRAIVDQLYWPARPYAFEVVPADILGQVYERFLGKVIRLTPAHRAAIEEKPEVKKAGGVYYTPTYIVDYIVKNTVGRLLSPDFAAAPPGATDSSPALQRWDGGSNELSSRASATGAERSDAQRERESRDLGVPSAQPARQGITPKQASKLRILDPACGSGSFLLGAYDFLLKWYLDAYVADGPEKHKQKLYQAPGGWKLAIGEKKQILLNNIYGVDIDPQAVEVTKLSLLLKVLEGESEQTAKPRLIKEPALPDLDRNIKCGNSLIGPDFYRDGVPDDEETKRRVNSFNWADEFPEIMKRGGFDGIIGNPPYLFITELRQPEKFYYAEKYSTCEYRFDVYGLFLELAVARLLKTGALVSFIIPHTLLSNDSFQKLRRFLLAKSDLLEVMDVGPGVFQAAKNETMILLASKQADHASPAVCRVILTTAAAFPRPQRQALMDPRVWASGPKAIWNVQLTNETSRVVQALEKHRVRLGDLCSINQGLRTGDNEKYLKTSQPSRKWKQAAGGSEVGRYEPLPEGLFVYYEPSLLDAPRRREIFESPEKLVVQEIRNITLARRIVATYDAQQFYCLQSTNVINLKPHAADWSLRFLLGVLNSTAANFYFRQRFAGNNHIASNQLAQIPVPTCQTDSQSRIASLVEQLLELHRKTPFAKTEREGMLLQRQIDATEREIDQLVYQLYGLTDEEIALVESATAPAPAQ